MSPPLLRPKVVFSITINPNDSCQYFPKNYPGDWKTRMSDFKKNWSKRFIELFSLFDIDYWLPVECSEPFRSGKQSEPRLHFHGLIRFKTEESVLHFLLNASHWLLQWSNFKIDALSEDPTEWIQYSEKHHFLPFPVLDNIPPNYEDSIDFFFPNQFLFFPEDGEEIIE